MRPKKIMKDGGYNTDISFRLKMNVTHIQNSCLAILSQILVFSFPDTIRASSCITSSFSNVVGYVLQGYILGEIEVDRMGECKKRCIISKNCRSLNIITQGNGRYKCQLNSELKENGPVEQFLPHGSGNYYGLEVHA